MWNTCNLKKHYAVVWRLYYGKMRVTKYDDEEVATDTSSEKEDE